MSIVLREKSPRPGQGSASSGKAFLSALAVGLVALSSPLLAAPTANGRIVYSAGSTTPQNRAYTASTNAFAAASAMQTGAGQAWIVDRAAPTRTEHLAGYVTTGGVLYVQRWNGTAWSAEWNVTVGGNGVDGRRFDIAYENTTGDAIVVYSNNTTGTNELRYRVWNGSSWTAATNLDSARLAQIPSWIKLVSRRASDEIALAVCDRGTTTAGTAILTSLIWSGTAWANEPAAAHATNMVNTTGQLVQNDLFDLAYESLSGDLLVIFTTATPQQNHRTYSGGTWGTVTSWGTARAAPLQMVASANPDPSSNQILCIFDRSTSANVYARVWDGGAFGTQATVGTNGANPAIEQRTIAGGWLTSGASTAAVVFWGSTTTTNTIDYNYTTDGGASWVGATTYTGIACGSRRWFDLDADPQSADTLMLTLSDSNNGLFARQLTWNGTALTWATPTNGTITTALASITSQNFDFAYDRANPNGTSIGTVSAAQTTGASPSIVVTATYTNDLDADNSLSYRYRTPSGTGTYGSSTVVPHSSSPYNFTVSGLTCGASYDVEVTYVDPDGVSGTNPTTVTITPTSCATAGTVAAAPTAGSCTGITFTAPYSNDANGNATLSYRYRTPSGGGTWSGSTSVGHAASPFTVNIPGLTFNASYDVEVTYLDADGVSGTAVQTGSATAGAGCTGAGTATAAQTPGATPSIAVSAPYTGDADGDNTLSYRYRTPTGTGTWTTAAGVAHSASPYGFTISGLVCGSSYDVEVTYHDADGIGSGTAVQTISNLVPTNCTATGAMTASGGSCGSIAVTAPYSQDADGDNTLTYRYRTPTGTGTWTAATGVAHSASPFSFTIPDLTAGTYDVEATYVDADGVSGTNPRTVSNLTVTASCTTTGTVTVVPTPGSCSSLDVSASYTGDTNSNSTLSYRYRTPSGSGAWVGPTSRPHSASPYAFSLPGLTAGATYDVEVTFVDATDGVEGSNPRLVTATVSDCRVAPGVPSASVTSCTRIVLSAPYTNDGNGNSTTTISRGASGSGPWTTVCSALVGASPRTCTDNGVTALGTYYYHVAFADADGVIGSSTQVIGPYSTPACAVNDTTVGSVTATNSNCGTATSPSPGAVLAVATFTGDANQDGTTVLAWAPSSGGPWTPACTTSGPSPRQCSISGLAPGVTYWVRAEYSDADGVTGTSPTAGVSTAANLPTCAGDTAAPTITLLSPSRNAVLSGDEIIKVQVWDAVGVSAVTGQVDGTAPAGFNLTFAVNLNYSCGVGCSVYQVSLPAKPAGPHYVAVRAADALGNVAIVTIPFRAIAAEAGNARLVRRTTGSQLCIDCHNLQTHSSQNTSTTYGNWANDCATCHTPHQTRNIYLFRPQVDTPRSGRKTVDFRNTTGKADFSYATVTTSGNGACEVCHTRTKDPSTSAARYRNSGEGGNGHYDTPATTARCTGCHPHAAGFKAGESEGGATCSGCHSTIWNGMTGGVAKLRKHTLGDVKGTNDASDDTGLTWASPLSANAAAVRSCVNTCHDDHIHNVDPAASPDTSASHNSLGYVDATSQVSRAATTRTTATKAKTDFDGAAANGGMCVSCHRFPVDATHPAIDKAAYDASAHDTTSTTPGGAWQHTQHDDKAFARNCTKCHWDRNDGLTPAVKKTGIGGVHSSDYESLLAGSTNPAGAPATFICYNCHGNGSTGTNYSGKNVATQIAKTRNHPANTDDVHNTVTEFGTAAFGNTLGVTGRHSNCIDCHDSHRAKAGTAASPGNLAGPPLEGTWGARLSTNPAFWADTAAASFTKETLVAGTSLEATLCFKCHTRYYWGTTATAGRGVPPVAPSGGTYTTGTAAFTNGGATVTGTGTAWAASSHVGWVIKNNANGTWHLVTAVASATSLTIAPAASFTAATSAYTLQMAETDVAKEFNPANVGNFAGTWAANETAGGFHPVLANAGGNLGRIATANLTTTGGFTWGAAGTNLMSCTDCHESDTTTDPNGPHGSTASFILRGPNTTWSAAVIQGAAGMPAGTFCMNCHSQTFASTRFPTHYSRGDHQVACWNCHAAVPHGGPRPGMLIAPGGAAAGVGGTIAGWDTAPPYWGMGTSTDKLYIVSYPTNNAGNWGQNNCGCNGTGH